MLEIYMLFITLQYNHEGAQDSWKVPAYGLFDLGLNHGFKFGDFDATLTARINNVLNTEYISDATWWFKFYAEDASSILWSWKNI